MNEHETAQRDEVERLNKQRLVNLMLKHGITIPAREFDQWRPTVEQAGRIEGVSDGLTCIMTNGLLGYFIREEHEPLYGHMDWFKWDGQTEEQGVPPTYYRLAKSKGKLPKKKPRTVISTAQAAAIVDRMLKKFKL